MSAIFGFNYDLSGKITEIIYPGSYSVRYEYYPGTGLLDKVTGPNGFEFAQFDSYSATNKVKKINYNQGVFYTEYDYYPGDDRLQYILNSKGLQDFEYQYSFAGDIEYIYDNASSETTVFNYDSRHRLLSSQKSGGQTESKGSMTMMSYNYQGGNGVHNVKNITLLGNPSTQTFMYDKKGNMTLGPDLRDPDNIRMRALTFNADNMPVKVELYNVEKARIIYDGNGNRARKIANGVETLYFSKLYEIKQEQEIKYIFVGDKRIARVKNGVTTFFLKDHLGSSTILTDVNGNPVSDKACYMPFGQKVCGSNNFDSDYQFTDQEFDDSYGLYNYNARLYDPAIGLFVSADTVIPNLYDLQALNRYAYCRNNPIINIDPSGHSWWSKHVTKRTSRLNKDIGNAFGKLNAEAFRFIKKTTGYDKEEFDRHFGSGFSVGYGVEFGGASYMPVSSGDEAAVTRDLIYGPLRYLAVGHDYYDRQYGWLLADNDYYDLGDYFRDSIEGYTDNPVEFRKWREADHKSANEAAGQMLIITGTPVVVLAVGGVAEVAAPEVIAGTISTIYSVAPYSGTIIEVGSGFAFSSPPKGLGYYSYTGKVLINWMLGNYRSADSK